MKKSFLFLLCFCILFCFCGCNKTENLSKSETLKKYADLGKIPECKYALWDNPEKIKSDFSKAAEEDEEYYYYFDEEIEYSIIDNGVYKIFYKTEEKNNGISYLTVFDIAYGFSIGTSIDDVKKELKNLQCVEEELSEENAFFIKSSREGKVLKYEFKKNTVMFIFDNDKLCATAIYTNDWE